MISELSIQAFFFGKYAVSKVDLCLFTLIQSVLRIISVFLVVVLKIINAGNL